jgi:hypothetical protein
MTNASGRFGLKLMLMLAGAMVWAGTLAPARAAIEIQCIEASRYKYLYRMFDNNPAKVAAFFAVDQNHLPAPDTCRAVLVTGQIDSTPGQGAQNDFDRLVSAIQAGGGWLATLYLASPGGSVGMGLRLGEITRMFWLNSHGVEGGKFDYVPDFIPSAPDGSSAKVPPDLQDGWQNYAAATQSVRHVAIAERRDQKCASACTYMYTGGIDRQGPGYFHRAGSLTDKKEQMMTDLLNNLERAGERIVAFYKEMDAGDAAIETYQSTTSATVAPQTVAPYPRYVDDYLNKVCASSNSGKKRAPAGQSAEGDFAAIQCRVGANTKERLTQFAKLCGSGVCDHRVLYHETSERVRALLPENPDEKPHKPEDPRRGSRRNH